MAVAAGRPKFDFIPAMVGTGAGLTSGLLRSYGGSLPAWRMGVFNGALLALGVAGHFFDWNNDLSYGLQISGAYGLAERVGPAIAGKSAVLILEDAVPNDAVAASRAQRAAAVPATHAGCSSCAAAALRSPEAVRNGSPAAFRGDVVRVSAPPQIATTTRTEALGIL
ncbi:MAG TPA: hypothetical protein VNE21_04350 [Mycobacteriales bacterium]|nr:hypothetical protein [Mycobacteriales bacterium]